MLVHGVGQRTKLTSVKTQHCRLWIPCAELDTTIQDFVVKLLDRKQSGDGTANRSGARREEQDG